MKLTKNPVFRDYLKKEIPDVKAYVSEWLSLHPKGEIYVGCDSKVRGKLAKYSTVVCLWDVGHGVSEIYKNEVIHAPKDSYSRLWDEVTRAVEVASCIKELGKITVHVDINSNPEFPSNRLYDASIGFISSMGFIGQGKPLSWAATCGAHRHCQ